MSIAQIHSLKNEQKLNSKQIQLFRILSLPTAELEQYISNEMAINPVLEFESDTIAEPDTNDVGNDEHEGEGKLGEDYNYTDYMDRDAYEDYKYELNNAVTNEERKERPIVGSSEIAEFLIEQYSLLAISEEERLMGEYLIYSLDDDGYLRTPLTDLADVLSFQRGMLVNEKELEKVLSLIQTLDPIGVGARNLSECLSIQLRKMPFEGACSLNAMSILENHLEELSNNQVEDILYALSLSQDDFEEALSLIKKLNPKPAGANASYGRAAVSILPDFTVSVFGNEVELFLNQSKQPPLKISEEYVEMLSDYSKSTDKKLNESVQFIKEKVDSAKWFIEALHERESMMVLIAKVIVKHQKEYFLSGEVGDLKPLILKDVAEKIGAHLSTVSRIVNSKYIATKYGTVLIKDLFVQGLANKDGDLVTSIDIKKEIAKCIESEDKNNPVSDDEIVECLAKKNFVLSRRTVAKYRNELSIPNKSVRKVA